MTELESKYALPQELRQGRIRGVRDMSDTHHRAYQVVFDQHYVPYSWLDDTEFRIIHARIEWHGGIKIPKIGKIGQSKRLCVVITNQEKIHD